MTLRQLEILQHALGVDKYGRGDMYRNHFCAGGDDEATCRELVALGYMETFTRSFLPYYNCRERYHRFLKHDSGLKFREWLKYYGGRR